MISALDRFLIVCEGAQDGAFFKHLLLKNGIEGYSWAFPERPLPGGRQGFPSILQAIKTQRGFDELEGIVIFSDNDLDPAASFAEVQALVAKAGYGVPTHPYKWAKGGGLPDSCIGMIPRVDQPGDLELLCLEAAAEKWPNIVSCVEAFADCTEAQMWPINKKSKMKLRSLLSAVCKTDPNTGLQYLWSRGSAGEEYEIPLTHDCFSHIVKFLREAVA
jgi:hypothetical protein